MPTPLVSRRVLTVTALACAFDAVYLAAIWWRFRWSQP